MNFQNQGDATAVSMAAGKTTEWVEQSSYTIVTVGATGPSRKAHLGRPSSRQYVMMMKPEEAILQVTGMR